MKRKFSLISFKKIKGKGSWGRILLKREVK